MRYQILTLSAAVLGALGAAQSSSAAEQDAAPAKEDVLESIVVTAERRAEDPQKMAVSVIAIWGRICRSGVLPR